MDIKEKKLKSSKLEVEQTFEKYETTQEEVKELKSRLKRNVSPVDARQVIWDNIIQKVWVAWKYFQVVAEEREIFATITEFLVACMKETQK